MFLQVTKTASILLIGIRLISMGEINIGSLDAVIQLADAISAPIEVLAYLRRERNEVLQLLAVQDYDGRREQLLKESAHNMLQKIERKIEESRGNITLAECAEALGVHSTYVWKVLKAEKGFSQYPFRFLECAFVL